ncbi:hypothetical protein SAMN05216354_1713 [Xylanibacter ruminicola]|uniref:Uncharacterized protein n=1 Tax=Xylanibacter ruminicola TaxID=839 RepID=A0A1H5V353_XYLRU|nr:hypothetical protein SAMN05216354_1713 [Xylanibacter ruminicola]
MDYLTLTKNYTIIWIIKRSALITESTLKLFF